MQIVAAAAASYARAGYFTVIDGIVIPRWFLRTLQDALLSENVQVAYAVLRASKSTCIARAAGRHKERLPDADAVDQLWHEFANLGELEAHVLDTDELDPMQTADALAARLNKLLLRSERNTA